MKERSAGARHRHTDHNDFWDVITICLSEGPRTLAEIERFIIAIPRVFGFFVELADREHLEKGKLGDNLLNNLLKMEQDGWVEHIADKFQLTTFGQKNATEMMTGLQKAETLARKFVQPQTVSMIALVVHLVLAVIKLPAGLISGSVGLINDAVDTLLDGLSSLLVYLGFRFNRERAVNIVLVLLMLGTGGFTFFKAVQRFFVPEEPEVDWFTFLAAVLSALFCLGLWAYQRFVGLRSGSIALITQSVDSRNHVIVALGVIAGLIAALLKFGLLDTIVGLIVAGMILKSAIELAIETLHLLKMGEADLSRYRLGILNRYKGFRQTQMRNWMLYLLNRERTLTREELKGLVCQAFDFSDNPVLRRFGEGRLCEAEEMTEESLREIVEKGWVEGTDYLSLTATGNTYIKELMSASNRRNQQHILNM